MFEAQLKDVGLLRDSIDVISELIGETTMEATEEGLKMVAADRAVVAVVNFLLSKEVFDKYEADSREKMGVNLVSFLDILKRANTKDTMKIKLEDGRLRITFKGDSTRSFTLPLIDVSSEETPSVDKLEFKTNFKIDTNTLNHGIEDADIITDSVVFNIEPESVKMSAESDASSAQLHLDKNSDSLKNLKASEKVRSRYSLDYLKKIIKSKKFAEEAEIFMATDYPMNIKFDLPGKLKLGFILAPRVEEN